MMYYFTSDLHLGHANIIKYCGRTIFMSDQEKEEYENYVSKLKNSSSDQYHRLTNFKISNNSLDQMNEEIIRRWNERVKPGDIIFHVGDFCFKNSRGGKCGEGQALPSKYWISKLNGYIIFVKGNHDKNNSTKTIIERLVIGHGGRRINLVHDPKNADLNYPINITGHVHQKWEIRRIRQGHLVTDCINVGVDVWNFRPVTFDEIMSRYNKWLKGGCHE